MARILVADDDAELLELIHLGLTKKGHEVSTASDGPTALRMAGEEKFDLVILDVMMPGMDGYHVARQLTEMTGSMRPKIIIITCRDVNREQGIALMSGAFCAVQKPINMDELHRKVKEALRSPS